MKKLLFLVTLISIFAFSSACFAAGNSAALGVEEQNTDTMLSSLISGSYSNVEKFCSEDLKKTLNADTFKSLQSDITTHFGAMKETHLIAWERFDQGDRLTYLAAFEKEPAVACTFLFAKDGKLLNFSLSPLKANEQPASGDAASQPAE